MPQYLAFQAVVRGDRTNEHYVRPNALNLLQVTSANALAYNVIHNAMIKMTSAVTTTVIGEAKIVGLFILSALLLGEPTIIHIAHPSSSFLRLKSSLAVASIPTQPAIRPHTRSHPTQ